MGLWKYEMDLEEITLTPKNNDVSVIRHRHVK